MYRPKIKSKAIIISKASSNISLLTKLSRRVKLDALVTSLRNYKIIRYREAVYITHIKSTSVWTFIKKIFTKSCETDEWSGVFGQCTCYICTFFGMMPEYYRENRRVFGKHNIPPAGDGWTIRRHSLVYMFAFFPFFSVAISSSRRSTRSGCAKIYFVELVFVREECELMQLNEFGKEIFFFWVCDKSFGNIIVNV